MRAAHALTPHDRQRIATIAQAIRDEVRGCVTARCRPASIRLRNKLRRLGYPAERVFGFVLIDGNWDGEWGSDAPIIWAEDDPDHEDSMTHNWVVVGNLLVDITADQFNPVIRGEKFPPVYLTTIDHAPRHIPDDATPGGIVPMHRDDHLDLERWDRWKRGELDGPQEAWTARYRSLPPDLMKDSPLSQWGEVHRWHLGTYWTVPVEVPLSELAAVKAVAQAKARITSIRRARLQGVLLPPIELGVFSDGSAWIVDGNHRLIEARQAGLASLPVTFTFVGA